MACRECDLLVRETNAPDAPATPHHSALCPRCGALLYRGSTNGLEKTLALAGAALVLLFVVNTFPVIGLDIQGQHIDTNLIGAAVELWQVGKPALAALVLLTTTVMPLLELSTVIWLTLPLLAGRRPLAFVGAFRALQAARSWAMIEVFALGLLVALVKLAHLAEIEFTPAMLGLAALTLLLTAINTMIEPRDLWQAWQEAEQ